MKITETQIGLMKLAVDSSYGTTLRDYDSDEFRKLVKCGYAIEKKIPALGKDAVNYTLTEAGKGALAVEQFYSRRTSGYPSL